MGFKTYKLIFNKVMQSDLASVCKHFITSLMGTTYNSGEYIGLPSIIKNQLLVDGLLDVMNSSYKENTHSAFVNKPFRVTSYNIKSSHSEICLVITVEQLEEKCLDTSPEHSQTTISPMKEQVGGTHYKAMKIQPIEFITANNIGYMEGNVIKYVCRYKNKNGVEDLKKAMHYLQLLIEQISGEHRD